MSYTTAEEDVRLIELGSVDGRKPIVIIFIEILEPSIEIY